MGSDCCRFSARGNYEKTGPILSACQVERLIGREEVERIRVFFYTKYCTSVERVKYTPSWYQVPHLVQGASSVARRMDMEEDSAKVLACERTWQYYSIGSTFPHALIAYRRLAMWRGVDPISDYCRLVLLDYR